MHEGRAAGRHVATSIVIIEDSGRLEGAARAVPAGAAMTVLSCRHSGSASNRLIWLLEQTLNHSEPV